MPVDALASTVDLDVDDADLFDLDAEITVGQITAGPAITSWSVCTPGCTSPNGGSGCSYCC